MTFDWQFQNSHNKYIYIYKLWENLCIIYAKYKENEKLKWKYYPYHFHFDYFLLYIIKEIF